MKSQSIIIKCKRARRLSTGLLLLLGAGVLASCSGIKSRELSYAGATHYLAGDPHTVAILRDEPTRQHERIGEIVIDASTDPSPSITKIEQRIRTEAAKMGADAVVIVYDGIMPTNAYVSGPWWGESMENTKGRKIVGVAIKYQQPL